VIVCSCRRVNARTVEDAIEAGAHDVAEIRDASGAASRCQGCVPTLIELLAQHGLGPGTLDHVA
jgi:nitrite reductase (NADH) large subunit